jgi:hypothetical protein
MFCEIQTSGLDFLTRRRPTIAFTMKAIIVVATTREKERDQDRLDLAQDEALLNAADDGVR